MQTVDQATAGSPGDTTYDQQRAALLQRVLNSAELHRSARSREFLQYIGQRALAGATYISEQEIGIKVFGRGRDYDTAIDNIVRVNATHLRKRIEIYFTTEGIAESLMLQLPRGSYLPVFEARPADLEPELRSGAAQPAAGAAHEDSAAPFGAYASVDGLRPSHDQVEAVEASAPALRRWKLAALALGTFALAGLVLSIGLFLHLPSVHTKTDLPSRGEGVFWSGFLRNGKPTDLVLADTTFAVMQDMIGHPISLKQYTDRNYMSHLDAQVNDERLKHDLQLISGRTYGSFAEFRFAEQLTLLAPPGTTINLQSARDFSAGSLASHNAILVGSRRSNPWQDLYDDRLSYGLESDINTGVIVVQNRHPHPGEPAQFILPSDPNDLSGFCLIASLPIGDGAQNLLMIQGTGSEETQAAGDFLSSPEELAKLGKVLGRSTPGHFEVLLRTRKLPGVPLSVDIVSARAN